MVITTVVPENSRLLQDIADTLARVKKIVVVTGAGISTNCGIPVILLHLFKIALGANSVHRTSDQRMDYTPSSILPTIGGFPAPLSL